MSNFLVVTKKLSDICVSVDTTTADAHFLFTENIVPITQGFFPVGSNTVNDIFATAKQYYFADKKNTFARQTINAFTGENELFNGVPFEFFKNNYSVIGGTALINGAGFIDGLAYLSADSYLTYLIKLPQANN